MEDPDGLLDDEEFELFVAAARRVFRPSIVAAIYIGALTALACPLYKSLVVGAIAFFAVLMPLGSRVAQALAVALLTYVLGWWLGAFPDPSALSALATNLVAPR